MIWILLSEIASQTLNSIMLKCVVCMDKLKLVILSQVIAFVQLVYGLLFILLYLFIFEVYIQRVFELFVLEELNPPVLNLYPQTGVPLYNYTV